MPWIPDFRSFKVGAGSRWILKTFLIKRQPRMNLYEAWLDYYGKQKSEIKYLTLNFSSCNLTSCADSIHSLCIHLWNWNFRRRQTRNQLCTRKVDLTYRIIWNKIWFFLFITLRTAWCLTIARPQKIRLYKNSKCCGAREGAVLLALASHQCGPGSSPGVDAMCGLSFVVGSLLCSERFFSGNSGFPLSSKTNNSKFQFDQESVDEEPLCGCATSKSSSSSSSSLLLLLFTLLLFSFLLLLLLLLLLVLIVNTGRYTQSDFWKRYRQIQAVFFFSVK